MNPKTTDWYELNREYLMISIQNVMVELETNLSGTDQKKALEEINQNIEKLVHIRQRMTQPPHLDILAQRLGLSTFERKILLVCTGIELNTTNAQYIAREQGNRDSVYPTFSTLLKGLSDAHWDALSPVAALRKWRLIQLLSGSLYVNQSLRIDESMLHFLSGFSYLEEELSVLVKENDFDDELTDSQMETVNDIHQVLAKGTTHIIELQGGGDKSAFAKAVSRKLNAQCYTINAFSLPQTIADLQNITELWNRQALLHGRILYLETAEWLDQQTINHQVLFHFINNCRGVLILDGDRLGRSYNTSASIFEVKNGTREEQQQLWLNLLNDSDAYGQQIRELVEHFNLPTTVIVKAAIEINRKAGENMQSVLWKTCCKYTRPGLEHLAQRMKTLAHWDDIVLPKEDVETLREIVMHVRYRSKVYQEGGFNNKLSRGLGITALFSGPSGTGKTMAAEVIANELKLDLYRVDLSQVVNKYIGETEKNLKKIFDAAEDAGAILLFDEADALFGKRNEARNSNDRYSNLQVGYLLQRMENFNGLAIMTTNIKNALDSAFERRIRFSIHFERPGTAQRKEIWLKAFPNSDWINGVDYDKLASLNVPGGNIRNIAMKAAFLATAEDTKIGMKHLLKATKSECKKVDKHLSRIEIKDWE